MPTYYYVCISILFYFFFFYNVKVILFIKQKPKVQDFIPPLWKRKVQEV